MASDTQSKLDSLYHHIKNVILSRQHPVTGLFPASTSVNNHGDYTDAWVRDNVYSIQAVWALYLAYKRASNPDKRAHELEYTCIKMMRGLLFAMMRQSPKVEAFKHSLDPIDSLHAKYDTKTGLEVVADDAWGHLQIDATSFYLLTLAQMTKAGSKLIYNREELNFIQNLIYYISRTYRTPDYGIWERGNKVNNGKAEINASSVGMAKAAMEALDGLNLFGNDGPEWAVIHSFADAVARAGSVLQSLLPKESRSKEVDGALLSIISFPAFALNDEKLTRKTRKEILDKLGGNYGCKRFLLDGHQTVIEDHSRIYYEHDELINFEHIESEWPLFYTYLYIDRLFARDWESANFYRYKLEELMVERDGERLLPELYYVPEDKILAEKEKPGSQERLPNDNLPLVWAQSLYLVGKMIDEELITTDDLDPLGLHKVQHNRKSVSTSMVVLAKNEKVKEQLVQAGCLCQTIDEIAPVGVISSEQLIELYHYLGASDNLGLTGRPSRALNSLATSQPFTINDQNYLCLSWIQNEDKDYTKTDPTLFKEHIQNELKIIDSHWYYPANAVFTVLIDDAMCEMPNSSELLDFIRQLQNHECDEFHVTPQSAKNAFKSGSRRSMTIKPTKDRQLGARFVVSEEPWPIDRTVTEVDCSHLYDLNTDSLLSKLLDTPPLPLAIETLVELGHRRALMNTIPNSMPAVTAYKVMDSVYVEALLHGDWYSVRRLFSLMIKPSTDLATYIADITVRQRVLVLGDSQENETHISSPLHQKEILDLIHHASSSSLTMVLHHEIISIAGALIKIHPEYFDGVRTIRIHSLALLCARQLDSEDTRPSIDILASATPYALYQALKAVLIQKHEDFTHVATKLRYNQSVNSTDVKMKDVDWFDWRTEQGLITKLPEDMLAQLWDSLSHAQYIVFGDTQSNTILDCKRTLSSMTPGEDTFALLVESLTSDIHPSWYKSLIFEALYAFIQFCEQHKGNILLSEVNLPVLVSQAAHDRAKEVKQKHPEQSTEEIALDEFAQLTPSKVGQYLRWAVSKQHSQQHQA
ncbi:glycoside hydrolase family 15 protein [Marinomonas mediterranea]|jgi:Glycosyl hydrolases family 15.|uniref:Phosphorylase kinase alphabeta n=1 Tax=Marinomonas mediterranea (strain ATCC 700492 / JCM 21426 / NBRC 103028 / MMB-1) TaxID=717774 RepID=F2K2G5_MARM1|nr:glycoside hydrolase family 15 protein [Marinomonas mediterranea]ADZ92345.1 phosphorylase kinase alphabeta [Marinomonas mediterranea MMB-1]WCN10298.1 phosphorylase kinase [Marinomonas mediterranea]WCN18395.1 phosphorylase kinase [Marinomonas mediterranea MMB-1]